MASKKPKKTTEPVEASGTIHNKYERFESAVIHRSELKNAPYNPRILNDHERRRLQAGIKKNGLLAPITWNARTGFIVSGHQRMAVLDSLNGTADYTLTVSKVDLTDAEEKEANLLFNNPGAQGDWDLVKLDELLKDSTIELVGTGFDMADVYRLLGDAPGRSAGEVDELATKLRENREAYDKIVSNSAARDKEAFYLVLVFRDDLDRDDFCKAFALDENRFQDGRLIRTMLEQARGSRREIQATDPQVA
jgi:ParB-like nuclease family protein